MAQIYQAQAQFNPQISAPNTGIAEHFDKKAQQGAAQLDRIAAKQEATGERNLAILERDEKLRQAQALKAQDYKDDLLKKQGMQIIKNAETEFGWNPAAYQELTEKSLKTLFDAVPDSPHKDRVMAEVLLAKSGADASVRRKDYVEREKKYLLSYKESRMQEFEMAVDDLALGFIGQQEDSEAALQDLSAFSLARDKIKAIAAERDVTDSNGNFIYDVKERALLSEAADNMGFYGALNYIQDNVQDNYSGAVAVYNRIKNNKTAAMRDYEMDEKTYAKFIKDAEAVLDNQISVKQLFANNLAVAQAEAVFKDAKIKVDKGVLTIGNGQYNNFKSLADLSNKYDAVFDNRAYSDAAEYKKLSGQRGIVNGLLVESVERIARGENTGLPGDRQMWFRRNKAGNGWDDNNAGLSGIKQADQNLGEFASAAGIRDKNTLLAMKADYYKRGMGFLDKSRISISSKEAGDIEAARRFANRVFIEHARAIAGNIEMEKDFDPKKDEKAGFPLLKTAYKNALAKNTQIVNLDDLQNQLGVW
jgi:hypothetical protein